ncbi:MAG TPA: hypothetical protein VKP68_20145 [Ramlibacter sp.]|nr:hypothetical protein [Ramlibacter sp.]
MPKLLLKIALRTLACAVVTYGMWLKFGTVSLVVCAPLFGVALARPIVDLLEEAAHATTRAAFRDVDGRHFHYRGILVDVVEDADSYRWMRLADVRKIVTGLPADPVLRNLFPEGLREATASKAVCIKAEALLQYLQKATDPGTLRFKHWVEREVVFPASRLRERNAVQ